MGRRFANILETVGNTPVVRINKLAPDGVNLYVKVEAFNPLGSVKDRLALGVIEDAERKGQLKPGQTVIEATSGNTGIGLAMVCAAKGYPLVVTMAETVQRRAAPADALPRRQGGHHARRASAASAWSTRPTSWPTTHGWFLTRQFENEANADMHSRTTAREIVDDFKDEQLDYWVTGYGTGGTLKGVGARAAQGAAQHQDRRLRAGRRADAHQRPAAGAQGRRHRRPAAHPAFKPHPMQGWTPDFIPKLTGDAVDSRRHRQDAARSPARRAAAAASELAQKEGIFVGITAGATFAGALQVCAEAPKGATILAMLPDTGERYSQHAAVRRHPRRHDRGRAEDLPLDAGSQPPPAA